MSDSWNWLFVLFSQNRKHGISRLHLHHFVPVQYGHLFRTSVNYEYIGLQIQAGACSPDI